MTLPSSDEPQDLKELNILLVVIYVSTFNLRVKKINYINCFFNFTIILLISLLFLILGLNPFS